MKRDRTFDAIHLTQDQTRRLLQMTLPPYTDRARKAAEAAKSGLWDKISPQVQTVMNDVAYSVAA